jgi:secreted trypsin-like serine protease
VALTAAHCLFDTRKEQMGVKVQVHRRDLSASAASEGAAEAGLADYFEHPTYGSRPYLYDVALLKLDSAIPASAATPIALDDGTGGLAPAGAAARVMGWGSQDVACTEYDPIMREGDVEIATHKQCVTADGGDDPQSYNRSLLICAGKKGGGAATVRTPRLPREEGAKPPKWVETGCGDSGGPLVVNGAGGKPVQVGVVSWGYGNTWDVYMRVSGMRAWAMETMKKHA